VTDHAGDSYWSRPPGYCSAGGGLISTAPDYMRFGRMLLGGGALDGRQVLSRKTIELMTTNFMTPEQRKFPFFGFDYWKDRGFGLGLYVIDDPARHGGLTSRGQYGCRGVYGTFWFNDPKEDLTAVMMVQVNWPAVLPPILEEFETMVYQSIVD
jgi:CubicO group peptidase (beta-lactamase class C family)